MVVNPRRFRKNVAPSDFVDKAYVDALFRRVGAGVGGGNATTLDGLDSTYFLERPYKLVHVSTGTAAGDTALINAALASFGADGGTVFLMGDEYLLTQSSGNLSLVQPNNVRLLGGERGTTLKVDSGVTGTIYMVSPTATGSTLSNVMIENLTFNGNIASGVNTYGLFFDQSANTSQVLTPLTVRNCHFKTFYKDAIYCDKVRWAVFDQCLLTAVVEKFMFLENCEGVRVTNCMFNESGGADGQSAIYLNTCTRALIHGNEIIGMGMTTGEAAVTINTSIGCRVTSNNIRTVGGLLTSTGTNIAIKVNGSDNTVVSGNVINDVRTGASGGTRSVAAIMVLGCNDVEVTDNTITNLNSTNGVNGTVQGINVQSSASRVVIKGNVLKTFSGSGAAATGGIQILGHGCIVTNNTVSDAHSDAAFYLLGNYNICSNNVMHSSTTCFEGIDLNIGTGNVVTGNRVYSSYVPTHSTTISAAGAGTDLTTMVDVANAANLFVTSVTGFPSSGVLTVLGTKTGYWCPLIYSGTSTAGGHHFTGVYVPLASSSQADVVALNMPVVDSGSVVGIAVGNQADCVVANNSISGLFYNGITATANTGTTVISGNSITGSAAAAPNYMSAGIYLNADGYLNTVVGNVIAGTQYKPELVDLNQYGFAQNRNGLLTGNAPQILGVKSGVSRYIYPPFTRDAFDTDTFGSRLLALPIWVPTFVTLSALGIEVRVAGSVGAVFRLGIWGADQYGNPFIFVTQTAATVSATSTGEKTGAVTAFGSGGANGLNPGLYWVAASMQGGPATAPVVTGNHTLQPGFVARDHQTSGDQMSPVLQLNSSASGSLSALAVAYTTVSTQLQAPMVYLVVS